MGSEYAIGMDVDDRARSTVMLVNRDTYGWEELHKNRATLRKKGLSVNRWHRDSWS